MSRIIDFLRFSPYAFYKATRSALIKAIGRLLPTQLGVDDPSAPTDVLYGDGTWGPVSGGGAVTSVNGQTGAVTVDTLYTANGSTPGARTVTLGGNLNFSGNRVQATQFFAQAATATGTVYPVEVLATNGTDTLFRVSDTGSLFFGNTALNTWLTPSELRTNNSTMSIRANQSAGTAATCVNITAGAAKTNISGVFNALNVTNGFSATTGTGEFNLINVNGTINQTGGTGLSRGVYVNPTLTAVIDFRAFENATGKNVFNSTSGNTLIGTSTDTGEKLQVSGTAKATKFTATAAGSSSSVYPVEILNSGATAPLLRVAEDGVVNWGVSTSNILSDSQLRFSANSVALQHTAASGSTGISFTLGGHTAVTRTVTSGTAGFMKIGNATTFGPTSGTATYTFLDVIGTINQTGGANGITRGVYVNPTLTAAADFRSFENTVGNNTFNTTSGVTLIGASTTATSEKLQVTGTAKATKFFGIAAGTSSSVYPVEIQDSTATNPLFRVAEDGIVNWGNSANNILSTTLLKMSSNTVSITPTQTSTNQNVAISLHPGITKTYTSGSQNCVSASAILNVASGSAVMNVFTVTPSITQTGSASGITRAVYINPTLNTPVDFRALEISAGKVVFPLSDFADDTAAATGGIPINGLYHTSGTVKIRLT